MTPFSREVRFFLFNLRAICEVQPQKVNERLDKLPWHWRQYLKSDVKENVQI